MNKYIIELLKLESTVIIPNFGALMKSGKSLIFNSILKYNDQKLEKFIAEQENMDLQDVSNALAKYVREIIAVLEKGDEFLIVGVGSFYKSDSGKIALKIIENENEESTVVDKPITDEPKKETIVTSLYKEKPVKKENESSPTLTENDLIQSVSTKKTIKEEPVEVPQTPVDKKETPAQPEIIKEEVKKVIKTKPVKEKKEKPVKEKKKKKGLIWLLLLLLILIGGGIYVGLNWDNISAKIGLREFNTDENITEENPNFEKNELKPEEEKEEILITDSNEFVGENNGEEDFSEDDLVNTEEVLIEEKPEVVKETTKAVNKSLSFHVVVGAFGSESNAIGLVEKMKKDGFKNAQILGKYGSLYKVTASSHATKEEAIIGLEKAKSINEDAFMEKIKL